MKNTLVIALMFGTMVLISWCGQESHPIIDYSDTNTTEETITTNENTEASIIDETDSADNSMTPNTNTNTATTTTSTESTKSYTMADVATHNNEASCWTTINGNVYDLTSFVSQHPGGDRNILKICGIDGTMAFENKHGGQNRPEQTLAGFMIGTLTK